jgi:hypothetical protein
MKTILIKLIIALVSIYSILGFIVIPYFVQLNFSKIIKQELNTAGYIKKIYLNPYTFELELKDLLIKDKYNKTLLYIGSFYIDIDPTKLIDDQLYIKNIIFDSLSGKLIVAKDKSFNFSNITDHINKNSSNTKEKKDTNQQKRSNIIFILNNLKLNNTTLLFTDNSKSTSHKFETKPFELSLTNLNLNPDQNTIFSTNIIVKDTVRLAIDTNLTIKPILKANNNIKISDIYLAKINSYLDDDLEFDFNGIIDNISFNNKITIKEDKLYSDLNNLEFDLNRLNFKNDKVDLDLKKLDLSIKKISIEKDKKLIYNLNNIKLNNKKLNVVDLKKDKEKRFVFSDLNIDIKTISSDLTKPIILKTSLNTPIRGSFVTNSTIIQNPIDIKSNIILKNFTLQPYKEYIKDYAAIDLHSANIDTALDLKILKDSQNITGKFELSKLNIFHSITNNQLLKLNLFKIEDINYTNNNLFIEKIIIDNFDTKFKISKDLSTNMDNIVVNNSSKDSMKDNNSTKAKETKKENKPFIYNIKNINISNGKLAFSDHSMSIPFDTNIHHLKADIKNLSSKDIKTDILFEGIVQEYGLANIKATTNILNYKKDTDVDVDFQNINLTSFSPYSHKSIGNIIKDGRIWLDLKYKIKDSKLSSTNKVQIKNIEFEEDEKSTVKTNLPLGLAIALLEDNENLIELDVPVNGDINNPKFELSGAIWSAVGNIVKNIVTAPFKFLGSLLGLDGDDLSSVEFKYGQKEVKAPQKEKLDNIVNLLQKKRNIVIKVDPLYNKIKDSKILKDHIFNKMIKELNLQIDQELSSLYIKRYGDKKYKSILAKTKKEDISKILTKEIKKDIIITEKQLINLAIARIQNIKKYLLSKGINSQRLLISKQTKDISNSSDEFISIVFDISVK